MLCNIVTTGHFRNFFLHIRPKLAPHFKVIFRSASKFSIRPVIQALRIS